MPTRRASLLAALPFGAARAQAPQQDVLRFSVGQSWGLPFVERVGNRVVGGLLIDLMRALAEELDRRPQFVLLASARVDAALERDEVDLHCLLAKSWAPQVSEAARWSVPLMRLRDVLVVGRGGPADEAALARGGPWTFSAVHNYRYPTLEAQIAEGQLVRDNALNQWAVLEKLARGHTALGVVNALTLAAFQQRHPGAGLRSLRVVEDVAAHCLFAPRPRVPLAQLGAAARRLVQSGRLDRLLAPAARKGAKP
jgi:polar amino acid transport system substrate-binding protein